MDPSGPVALVVARVILETGRRIWISRDWPSGLFATRTPLPNCVWLFSVPVKVNGFSMCPEVSVVIGVAPSPVSNSNSPFTRG